MTCILLPRPLFFLLVVFSFVLLLSKCLPLGWNLHACSMFRYFFIPLVFSVFITFFVSLKGSSWSFFPTSNNRRREKAVRWTGNYTRQSDCPLLNLIDRLIMRSLESIRPKTENDRPGELCRCVVVFHFTLRNHRCDNWME